MATRVQPSSQEDAGRCGGRGLLTRSTSVAGRPIGDNLGRSYSPNTYSTSALRCSLSSGVLTSLLFAEGLGPDAIAIYCFPPASKVIGGAEKPDPTLIFHTSSSVVSSKAATVPSSSARKIRPPPVASVPL